MARSKPSICCLRSQLTQTYASSASIHEAVVVAFAQEDARSLAAVGIAAGDFSLPVTRRRRPKPKLAASAKLALQRALTIAVNRGERRIHAGHLLFGVLAGERGRAPRALQIVVRARI